MLGKLLARFREKGMYHDIIESLVAALEANDYLERLYQSDQE